MSQKLSKHYFFILFFSLLLMSCGEKRNPIHAFEESRPKSVKAFYAYPSTIRMLGKIMNDSNIDALSDIKKAKLFIEWKSRDADNRKAFLEVKNKALSGNFEELLTVKSKNSDVTVLISEKVTPVYLVFSLSSEADYILEIEGNISMKTLKDIGSLDINNMVDVINLGKPIDEEKAKNPEN